jgi:hypothetical protein
VTLGFRVAQASWFAAPVLAAGLLHIAIIRAHCFLALARLPLDLRLGVRGRRLFGEHKTSRGALVMIAATPLFVLAQAHFFGSLYRHLAVSPYQLRHPGWWGLLIGAGYILGELPNSFIKRQLDIAPGATQQGRAASLFWIVDQLDSVVGVFCLLAIVWRPDWMFVTIVFALALVLHPAVAALMVAMGLKARVG